MPKALACCLTLLAIAMGGPADAQPSANGTHSTDQPDLTLSGSDYEEIAVGTAKLSKLAGSSGQALLTAMETWVSSQFDLPAIHEHPDRVRPSGQNRVFAFYRLVVRSGSTS